MKSLLKLFFLLSGSYIFSQYMTDFNYQFIVNNLYIIGSLLIVASVVPDYSFKIVGISSLAYTIYFTSQVFAFEPYLNMIPKEWEIGIYIVGGLFLLGLFKKMSSQLSLTLLLNAIFLFVAYNKMFTLYKQYSPEFLHQYMKFFPLQIQLISMSVMKVIAWPIAVFFESFFNGLGMVVRKILSFFKLSIPKMAKKVNVDTTMEEIDDFGQDTNDMTVRGDMFEDFIASMWRQMGYKAYNVKELKEAFVDGNPIIDLPKEIQKFGNARPDKGLDVVVWNKDGSVKLIQAKHYSKDVGQEPVMEIIMAKSFWVQCFPKGTKFELEVWTNRGYKQSAIDYAKTSNVKLVGRKDIAKILNKFNNRKIKKI